MSGLEKNEGDSSSNKKKVQKGGSSSQSAPKKGSKKTAQSGRAHWFPTSMPVSVLDGMAQQIMSQHYKPPDTSKTSKNDKKN